jgi:glycine/sarcosine N-methyltransferase
MNNDPYETLAERYDWMKGENPARERFFRELFAKHGVRRVLDCACGTGSDLVLFRSMGLEVFGSDLSQSMLAQARKNLAKAQLDVPVRQADFCRLPDFYDTTFDAVVCLTNAINEVLEDSQLMLALGSLRAVLRAGGVFVFDQGQTDAGIQNPQQFCPIVNNPDVSRLLVTDYAGDIATVNILDLVHRQDECSLQQSAVRIRIRLQDSWAKVLQDAGFTDVAFFGDWDFSAYNKQSSRRLIGVARR